MILECLDQKLAVPDTDGAMWECSRADLASKSTLYAAYLVFNVLCLLTQRSFAAVRPHTLDRVTNAEHFALDTICNDWKIGRQQAIIINQKYVGEPLGHVAANELRDDLGANWRPSVRNSILLTHRSCFVERSRRVPVGDYLEVQSKLRKDRTKTAYEDILSRKHLQCSFQRGGNQFLGFVARDK